MAILNTLVQNNVLTAEDAKVIQKEAEDLDVPIEQLLSKRGIDPKDVLAAKGSDSGIPTRKVDKEDVPFNILKYIPEESATHYRFVPVGLKDGTLEVGIVDPDNIEARDALNFIAGKVNLPYKLFLISEEDFQEVLEIYKSLSGEVTKALSELSDELGGEDLDDVVGGINPEDIGKETKKGETHIIEEAPVTKIVATILRYAIEGNASDIHIEPMSSKVRVRFRIDGELFTSLVLPPAVHSQVVARIKLLCNMKLDEKRKPQDGRFSAKIEGREVDFRVSTFPTNYGEKVVMRILDKERGIRKLEEAGLSEDHLKMIREAIKKPYGMILISGPTGSGKSTTLYAMLNEVDKEKKNVLSLEDPVEYHMDGMSQSQVRPAIDYTFATGLRTTLRQDPDVIMVGEIRDKETAQLAVQAALTGHLVLSTIHTNDSIGVIPRLIDMGVDRFLIAPTIALVIAQRLVKKLCPNGGSPLPIEGSIKAWIEEVSADLPEEVRREKIPLSGNLYDIAQTADCPNGTRGRTGVFEMFEMDKELENKILTGGTELDMKEMVRKRGMLSLQEDAMIKCANQIVPFGEVNNLTS